MTKLMRFFVSCHFFFFFGLIQFFFSIPPPILNNNSRSIFELMEISFFFWMALYSIQQTNGNLSIILNRKTSNLELYMRLRRTFFFIQQLLEVCLFFVCINLFVVLQIEFCARVLLPTAIYDWFVYDCFITIAFSHERVAHIVYTNKPRSRQIFKLSSPFVWPLWTDKKNVLIPERSSCNWIAFSFRLLVPFIWYFFQFSINFWFNFLQNVYATTKVTSIWVVR